MCPMPASSKASQEAYSHLTMRCPLTCLIAPGLSSCQRRGSGMMLARRAMAPATTGHATEVPDRVRHPCESDRPRTRVPYVKISGFTLPYPSGSSHEVMPREEKSASLPSSSTPPTPITSGWSACRLRASHRCTSRGTLAGAFGGSCAMSSPTRKDEVQVRTKERLTGFISVPQIGPELPIPETITTLAETTSSTLRMNGRSAKSGPCSMRALSA